MADRRVSATFNGDETLLEGTWSPPDPEEQAAARRIVEAHAQDDEDLADLLSLLGLTIEQEPLGS